MLDHVRQPILNVYWCYTVREGRLGQGSGRNTTAVLLKGRSLRTPGDRKQMVHQCQVIIVFPEEKGHVSAEKQRITNGSGQKTGRLA